MMTHKSKIKIVNNKASSFLVRQALSALVLVFVMVLILPIVLETVESAKNIVPDDLLEGVVINEQQ